MQIFEIVEGKGISAIRLEEVAEGKRVWAIGSKAELRAAKEKLQIADRVVEDCMASDDVPKVEIYAEYDLGLLQRMAWQNEVHKPQIFRFIINRSQLIIVVEEVYEWLGQLIEDLQCKQDMCYTLGYIFYRILDCVIAEDKVYLEQMVKQTEKLEEDILNEIVQHFVKEIIRIRKQITVFKRHYDPLMDIVEDLIGNENEICSQEDVRYFKILKNRLNRLNHLTEEIDEFSTHVREAYDAQIDIRQNRIMKYFTLLTSLFLPLTLITGWYGMNFESMPESSWKYGYIYVIVISVLSSLYCLYYFKRKKWL